MPAFLIVDAEVTDPQGYDEYKRRVAPVIALRRQASTARVIAVDGC